MAQPWGPALSCCTTDTHTPAVPLTWPLFSKHLLLSKISFLKKIWAFFNLKNAPSVLLYSLGWWGLQYNQIYIQKFGFTFFSFPWYSHWPQPLAFFSLIIFWLYISPPPCKLCHQNSPSEPNVWAVLFRFAARKSAVKILHTRRVRAISVLGDKIPLLSSRLSVNVSNNCPVSQNLQGS